MRTYRDRKNGFTLMELLVVIAIVVSLSALGTVAVKGVYAKSKKVNTLFYVSELEKGVNAFYADHHRYPSTFVGTISMGLANATGASLLNELCGQPTFATAPAINTEGKNYIFAADSKSMTRTDDVDSKANGLTRRAADGKIMALQDGWGKAIRIRFDQDYTGVTALPTGFANSGIPQTSAGSVRAGFIIWSEGKDLRQFTADDIVSWD